MADARVVRTTLLGLLEHQPTEFYALMEQDPCVFFDGCLWTYDPRQDERVVPFVLWPYQRRWVRWLVERISKGEDWLTDKSRDMGVTWMVLGVLLWFWLTSKSFNILIGSMTAEDVDRLGDKDTHFERLRFMIRRLPSRVAYKYLHDGGFSWKEHSVRMRLLNPTNDSQIIGEAATDDFGRQKRCNVAWVDEMAMLEPNLQREIWMALGDTTRSRGATCTPKGRANHFAKLRFESSVPKRTLRWTMHPRKCDGLYYLDKQNKRHELDFESLTAQESLTGFHDEYRIRSIWYDAQDARRKSNPAEMAQEVDINYLVSGHPVFSAEWSEKHFGLTVPPVRRCQPSVTWSRTERPTVTYEDRADGEFWLFQRRASRKGTIYSIGVDVSEGLGDDQGDPDYHGVVVWDAANRKVAACLRTRNLSPRDVAAVVADQALRWNEALLTVERNGPGLAVIATLGGLLTGYDLGASVFRPRVVGRAGHPVGGSSGFKTTRESKPHLIELIRNWSDPADSRLNDERLVHEYSIFAHLPGYKMGAPPGSHDDLVMALGQALVAVNEAIALIPRPTVEENAVDELIALQNMAADGRNVDEAVKRLVG